MSGPIEYDQLVKQNLPLFLCVMTNHGKQQMKIREYIIINNIKPMAPMAKNIPMAGNGPLRKNNFCLEDSLFCLEDSLFCLEESLFCLEESFIFGWKNIFSLEKTSSILKRTIG